ncbi:hypothetical protein C8J57DRAFT_1225298 [Mycena rebaudengoi]|nr:hypothetical protein C8J57DRAFT_1225298 [Mycena rebaudengoi]
MPPVAEDYHFEYSVSGRATCNGDFKILVSDLRVGIHDERFGHEDQGITKYRHWTCVTPKDLTTLKNGTGGDMTKIRGFLALSPVDQACIMHAIEAGNIDTAEEAKIRKAALDNSTVAVPMNKGKAKAKETKKPRASSSRKAKPVEYLFVDSDSE